eukprot:1178107-Alexandrium_andersonii.AAC.1
MTGREDSICFASGHDVRCLRDSLVLDGGWQETYGGLDGYLCSWQAGAQSLPVGRSAPKPH